MGQERHCPLTETEERKHNTDNHKEKIVIDRIWNKRPDGFVIKIPTKTKPGGLVILEFIHMNCVTDQYVRRTRNVAESQYELSLDQNWIVSQRSYR